MKFKKLATALAVSCATFTVLNTMVVNASSHREAPAITERPKVDSTDLYMFNSYEAGREDYVTLLANYVPLQDPQGGPNYFSMDRDAIYEIHIDNDGDAVEDITFQFRFNNQLENKTGKTVSVDGEVLSTPLKHINTISAGDSSALGFNESYTLTVIEGNRRRGAKTKIISPNGGRKFIKPYDYVGNKTFSDAAGYQAYADQYTYDNIQLPNCAALAKVFVGQRKESFVVNLGETFDLVNYVPIEAGAIPQGIEQDPANNDLRAKNITTLALEVHKSCLTSSESSVIGAWTSASLRQISILNPHASFRFPEINGGAWVQVSRLGMPLVNELVIGIVDKDRFSSSHPKNDANPSFGFGKYVTNPTLPLILDALFNEGVNALGGFNPPIENLAPTNFPRNDLVATFLTGFAGVNQLPTVTASEMLRLNTAIPAVVAAEQNTLGVAAGDLAGFPNGRRPGDDVVDIALRVVMGALCHDVPLGPVVNGVASGVNLGLCAEDDAATGNVPYTDGAPISAADFDSSFPYLTTPVAGSPN